MARKRIVFVIVEGISDEESLGVILSRIYDKNEVFIHIMRRDITTENRVTPSNIISKLGNEIREYASSNHYKPADFKEIIHLTDMDGAFIPDESIIDDQNESTIKYSITNIHTCNKKGIEKRNHQKASNLNILCSCKSIWNTPYSLFYMSCNLDHVLHDKLKR